MTALDGGSGAEAAEAAHARLARGGADLRASLEAVAYSIRSIVARRHEPFAPEQPTIDEVRSCRTGTHDTDNRVINRKMT